MQARKDFRSQLPNTEKRLLADVGAREEELRARLEKEGGSDGLAAWQVVAERGCKTSEAQYEEARKKWEERKKKSLPVIFWRVCLLPLTQSIRWMKGVKLWRLQTCRDPSVTQKKRKRRKKSYWSLL